MGQLYLREEGDCFYRKGSSESETARRTRGIGVCRNLRPTVILTKCEIGDSGSSENFKGHSNYAVERAPVSLWYVLLLYTIGRAFHRAWKMEAALCTVVAMKKIDIILLFNNMSINSNKFHSSPPRLHWLCKIYSRNSDVYSYWTVLCKWNESTHFIQIVGIFKKVSIVSIVQHILYLFQKSLMTKFLVSRLPYFPIL